MDSQNDFIETARQVVKVAPRDHGDRIIWLYELGNALRQRYTIKGVIADLEEAIQSGQEALDSAPDDYVHRNALLDGLGFHLAVRFSKTGSLDDLEYAIRLTRQAIGLRPEESSDRDRLLKYLATQPGERDDLSNSSSTGWEEYASRLRQRGIHQIRGGPSDDRARRLTHLASHLGERYKRTGSSIDLEEAIEAAQIAVDMTPLDSLDRIDRLNTLANQKHERYGRTGDMSELENVIQLCRELVEIHPENSDTQALLKSNLGGHIGDSYLRTDDIHALDEAIRLSRDAANGLSQSHADLPGRLSNLAIWLAHRYVRDRESSDVEEAIKAGEQAIEGADPGNPSMAQYMSNLADCYWNRHTLSGCNDDFDHAVRLYRSAFNHPNSTISSRIAAGKHLFETFAHTSHWEEALDASQSAFGLLPQLAPRSLGFADKQRMLGRVVDLACDTAAVAFHAGKDVLLALSVLEKGRGILASAIELVRTDVLDLQESHPDFAERFLELRQVLDAPIEGLDSASLQAVIDRRAEASLELDTLISEIREHPGFKNFLDSPSEEELRAAAELGPIVVINTSRFRCDAILIEQDRIRSLSLPNLTVEKMDEKERQGQLRSSATFKWLWDVAACPILDALGINSPPPSDDWPHIWWIPTGRLSKLPFHAFGYHYPGSRDTVLDRVTSSYSSSIQALINGRKRRSHMSTQAKAVLVAMQDSSHQNPLPFAKEELSIIQNLCGAMGLDPCVPERQKQAIMENLQDCKMFHFAGHGKTDKNPSESGLFLEDGILTVADLMDINLRKNAPFLEYLSACGTGRVGGDVFFDENVHLISACQLAGFRHVIGTVWEVSDESCVEVSRIIYESMRDQVFTDRSVCWGLHKALKIVRDSWLSSLEERQDRLGSMANRRGGILSRDIVACDEEDQEMARLSWVPFVHFGV